MTLIGLGRTGRDARARNAQRRTNATLTQITEFGEATIDNTDSPYDITIEIDVLYVDTTAGSVTVNLYSTASFPFRNRHLWIKNIGTANQINVVPVGTETIDAVVGPRTIAAGGYMILTARANSTDWSQFNP